MLYFALRAFGFLITNINIRITIYCSSSLLSFSILSLLFLILSSISLPLRSIFLPIPFSFSLSFRRMCSIFSLSSRHILHLLSLSSPSFPFLFSLSSSPPLSFSSLTHTLSPPYCTSILLFSLFSLTYLCFCPSIFLFSPSSSKFSSVSPVSHPI
jgi:hypothetical protein